MVDVAHQGQDAAKSEKHLEQHADGPDIAGLTGWEAGSPPQYAPALAGHPALTTRGNGPVRTALMLQMQRRYGNRAVQRFLQHAAVQPAAVSDQEIVAGSADDAQPGSPVASASPARMPIAEGAGGEDGETVRAPQGVLPVQRDPPDAGAPPAAPAAPATVRPTGIASTAINRATPGLSGTYYGWVFTHTLSTSGGTITPDITIAERVTAARDDFGTGFGGVALGTLTWGPGAGGTAPISGNNIGDNIGTNNVKVTNFVPHPPKPGLPAIMSTPQELHYRVGTGPWTKFADVPITVTLQTKAGGGYEVVTSDNSVGRPQTYTGPT